jgi:hypothetical protein
MTTMVEIEGYIVHETDRAILIVDERTGWLVLKKGLDGLT